MVKKTQSRGGKGRSGGRDYDQDDVFDESDKHAGLHMIGTDDATEDVPKRGNGGRNRRQADEDDEDIEPVFDMDGDSGSDDDDSYDDDVSDDDGAGDVSSEDGERRRDAIAREEKVLSAWGKQKSAFYNHDADVEIDDDAAAAEEAEVIRLQKKRNAEIDEDDISFGFAVASAKSKKHAAAAAAAAGSKSAAAGQAAAGSAGKGRDAKRDSIGSAKGAAASAAASDSSKKGDGNRRSSSASAAESGAAASAVEVVERNTSGMTKQQKLDIIAADTPELLGLLQEMKEKAEEVRNIIAPILEAVKSGALNAKEMSEQGLSYLEVKHNLLLSYVTNITFVCLLKAEGRSIRDHPVIQQLVHIRTLLERMRPLDARMQQQINRMLKAARSASSAKASSNGDDSGDDASNNDNEGAAVDYSDIKGHPKSIAMRAAKHASTSAGGDSDEDEAAARPNPKALLKHGQGSQLAASSSSSSSGSKQKDSSKSTKNKKKADSEDDEDAAMDADDAEDDGGLQGVVGKDGVYRPLRRAAVPYDGEGAAGKKSKEEKAAQRARQRLAKSKMLADMRAQYTEAPEESDIAGGGSDKFSRSAADEALDKLADERSRFEEDNFVRLTMNKAEKKARKAREREVERWDSLAELENFGDIDVLSRKLDENDENGGLLSSKAGSKSSKRSLNDLAARSAAGVASSAASGMADGVGKKRTRAAGAAQLDLGALGYNSDGDDGGDGYNDDDYDRPGSGARGGGGDEDDGGEADPFYAAVEAAAQRKKAKKAAEAARAREETSDFIRGRKDKYELDGDEVDSGARHRHVGRDIMKNRGLTKYRKSDERNPRVHNRKKAESFVKRRKGQVAPMRNSGAEAGMYGGESTGIRANISRSRKIKG